MGLVTASEVAETVAAIRDRVAMALIVDADTGFGGALNVAHTVRRLERAGASAIQIEDQTFPKRCGHMAGKSVVSLVDSVGRIKAALDARVHALIVARTDAVAVTGLADALDRAGAFLHAGADVVFVEGPRTIHEASAVAQSLAARTPLVYNLVEGGTGVIRDGADLQALGYAIALHPLVLLHGLARAAPSWLNRLREERSTKDFDEELADLAIMNELTGAHDLIALSDRYEPETDDRSIDYQRAGFGGSLMPGRKLALIIIDVVMAYLDPQSPLYLGGEIALASNLRLAEQARACGVPIIFTNVSYQAGGLDGGVFFRKVPALKAFLAGSPLGAFHASLAPADREVVISKQYPSAFFGTSLASMLHARGVDTVLLAGFSTSGCVRATALDALQHGFIPFVVRDACADRDQGVQAANLFDLQAKIAEVISEDEARRLMDCLPG
ncbi:MAG: isochorismatase family protein [Alphaproteobacteria bacterium]